MKGERQVTRKGYKRLQKELFDLYRELIHKEAGIFSEDVARRVEFVGGEDAAVLLVVVLDVFVDEVVFGVGQVDRSVEDVVIGEGQDFGARFKAEAGFVVFDEFVTNPGFDGIKFAGVVKSPVLLGNGVYDLDVIGMYGYQIVIQDAVRPDDNQNIFLQYVYLSVRRIFQKNVNIHSHKCLARCFALQNYEFTVH